MLSSLEIDLKFICSAQLDAVLDHMCLFPSQHSDMRRLIVAAAAAAQQNWKTATLKRIQASCTASCRSGGQRHFFPPVAQ